MFKWLKNKIYSLFAFIRYRCSYKKNYLYMNARCINTTLRGHNVIFENSILKDCELGEYSYIQKNSCLNNTKIGKFCSIADNVRTGFGNHPTNMVSTFPSFYYDTSSQLKYTFHVGMPIFNSYKKAKNCNEQFIVVIGNDVWIGSHVLIMDGVTIGDGAVIAAGAVVASNIEPYGIYGGVPAKLIRYRMPPEKIELLKDSEWWNKEIEWIKSNMSSFLNVDLFIKDTIDS